MGLQAKESWATLLNTGWMHISLCALVHWKKTVPSLDFPKQGPWNNWKTERRFSLHIRAKLKEYVQKCKEIHNREMSFLCWTFCIYSLFSNPTITFPVALWWMFKTLAGLFLLQPPDWLSWFPVEATTSLTWCCEAHLKLHSLFIGYAFSESCLGFFASASWSNVIIYFSYLFLSRRSIFKISNLNVSECDRINQHPFRRMR